MSKLFPYNSLADYSLDGHKPFAKIKLIALDLDGTLVKSNQANELNQVKNLIRSLQRYKVMVTIATGRTLSGAEKYFNIISSKRDTPIILYNGSVIINKNITLLNQHRLERDAAAKVVSIVKNWDVMTIAYSCNFLHSGGLMEVALGFSNHEKPKIEYNGMQVDWKNWDDELSDEYLPSTIVIHTTKIRNKYKILGKMLSQIDGVSISYGGSSYIEVRPYLGNKGYALEYVANFLKLGSENILAVGDNDNDAEMLSWAGVGVSVNTGSEMAIENSDYQSSHGVIACVIEVLRHVREAKRLFRTMQMS